MECITNRSVLIRFIITLITNNIYIYKISVTHYFTIVLLHYSWEKVLHTTCNVTLNA